MDFYQWAYAKAILEGAKSNKAGITKLGNLVSSAGAQSYLPDKSILGDNREWWLIGG